MTEQTHSYISTFLSKNYGMTHKVQNLIIREYARKLDLSVGLSATELAPSKNLNVLKSVLKEGAFSLIISSKKCLEVNLSMARRLLSNFVERPGSTVYFAYEEEKITTLSELKEFFWGMALESEINQNKSLDFENSQNGKEVFFLQKNHSKATDRKYEDRAMDPERVINCEKASLFGADYWDGDRRFGYGGYHYDGRWKEIALKIIDHYNIRGGHRVLDIGCGKGFLLYEIKKINPKIEVFGLDISEYALDQAEKLLPGQVQKGHASHLPFDDNEFDFVLSLNCLHNLSYKKLLMALHEISRVGKKFSWICVESYRNMSEKVNLLNWQLTCNAFYSKEDWEDMFQLENYKGDYEFIYFE